MAEENVRGSISGDVHPLTNPPLTSSSSSLSLPATPAVVSELSSFFVVCGFLVTMVHPAVCAYTANAKSDYAGTFIIWVELPFTCLTVFLSMIMQPKRDSKGHKIFLAVHYFMYTVLAEILRVMWEPKIVQITFSIMRSVLWTGMFYCIMRMRKMIADMPPLELSNFLTHRVLKEGILAGLSQILFVMFDIVRCDTENGWEQCTRTLASGGGLSALIVLFVVSRIAVRIPPRSIMEKHIIPSHRLITMDLSVEERVVVSVLVFAAFCALWLLGNYGAEGEFSSDGETIVTLLIVNLGFGSCAAVLIYKFFAINAQISRSFSFVTSPATSSPLVNSENAIITKGSSLSFWLAVVITFALQVQHAVLAMTLNEELMTTTSILVPLTWMFTVFAIFSNPRRRDKKYMMMLRFLFLAFALVGELLYGVYSARLYWIPNGRMYWTFFFLLRFVLECFVFHELLKIRAKIGRLDDETVSTFLKRTLFGGGLQVLGAILFVCFRAINCLIERGFAECKNTATSGSGFICVNIAVLMLIWILMSSVHPRLREEVCLTAEKICALELSPLRRLEGLCFLVCGVCSLVLFSLVNSKRGSHSQFFVNMAGGVGTGSITVCLFAEWHVTRMQQRRLLRSPTPPSAAPLPKKLISRCHPIFHFFSFCLTVFFQVLYVMYAITLEDQYWKVAIVIQPLAILSFIISFLMQPRRTDKKYVILLVCHFVQFVILTEITADVGGWLGGWKVSAILGIFRILFIYLPIMRFAVLFRQIVASASDEALNKYLTITLMRNGGAAALTMLFFCVETFSCKVQIHNDDSNDELFGDNELGSCVNSAYVGMFLSLYVLIFFIHDIAVQAVPRSIQASFAIPLSRIAKFDLKRRHKVQFILMASTFVSALFLFSMLGVPDTGPYSLNFYVFVGGFGCIAMIADLFVDLFTLRNKYKTYTQRLREGSLRKFENGNVRDGSIFGRGVVEENMISGGLL
mmetsp:Transcript_21514/g.44854  ORF Transcript_21514/g.44854 Transcript_21514/m.44854 type:complete len:972 (-) Transcript_21514:48-2963(-)